MFIVTYWQLSRTPVCIFHALTPSFTPCLFHICSHEGHLKSNFSLKLAVKSFGGYFLSIFFRILSSTSELFFSKLIKLNLRKKTFNLWKKITFKIIINNSNKICKVKACVPVSPQFFSVVILLSSVVSGAVGFK